MNAKPIYNCPGCSKQTSGSCCPAPSRPRCSRPPTSLLVTAGAHLPKLLAETRPSGLFAALAALPGAYATA